MGVRIERERMKEPEYIEGRQARENFEEGMKALFKVPKDVVGGWPSFAGTTTTEDAPALLVLQSWARCCPPPGHFPATEGRGPS